MSTATEGALGDPRGRGWTRPIRLGARLPLRGDVPVVAAGRRLGEELHDAGVSPRAGDGRHGAWTGLGEALGQALLDVAERLAQLPPDAAQLVEPGLGALQVAQQDLAEP